MMKLELSGKPKQMYFQRHEKTTMCTNSLCDSSPLFLLQHLKKIFFLLFVARTKNTALLCTNKEAPLFVTVSRTAVRFQPKPVGRHFLPGISGILKGPRCCKAETLQLGLVAQPGLAYLCTWRRRRKRWGAFTVIFT